MHNCNGKWEVLFEGFALQGKTYFLWLGNTYLYKYTKQPPGLEVSYTTSFIMNFILLIL